MCKVCTFKWAISCGFVPEVALWKGGHRQEPQCRRQAALWERRSHWVGKPSWKASHLRRNHLKPHKDPKALTPSLTVGLTEYQPEASATESGVGTAKTTDKL